MTEKEIIQALRCCQFGEPCASCPAVSNKNCIDEMHKCAADLIEHMTAEVADLRKETEWKEMVISLAQRKQAKAEAERDALIEQIKERHDCLDCKHNDFCDFDSYTVLNCMNCVQEGCPCPGCFDSRCWEWRGLPEAPEKGGKA